MSVRVMSMVWERYPDGGGDMLLALALADHASDDGTRVFPSVASLAKKTRQSVRTVGYQLAKMRAAGWLIPVGHVDGGRGMATEYLISAEWIKGADFAGLKNPAICDGNPANGSTKPCNGLQGRDNRKEPSKNHQGAGALEVDFLVAEGVEKQHAADWLTVRKKKDAPLTLTAWSDVVAQAEKAGITPAAAVAYAAARSWQGFRATWHADEEARERGAPSTKRAAAMPWWGTDEGVIEKGASLAPPLAPRPGETIHQFKGRVQTAIGGA